MKVDRKQMLVLEKDNNGIYQQVMKDVYECEDIEKRVCKNCKWRDEEGHDCQNSKIKEGVSGERKDDELVYSFPEGGGFWVGENFGCVHWEEKE